jgi:mono/diheme cytochrome c family protein
MKSFVAGLALLAVLCDVAVGGPAVCRRNVRNVVVTDAVVVTPAIVATYVPVTVATYSAAYVPPATDPAVIKGIADLGTRLDRIEAKIGAPAPNPPAPTPSPAPAPAPPMPKADLETGAARFAANCARCHDAAAPKGGLTLFRDGQAVALSCEQALACINAVSEGRMPKATKLAAEDDGSEIVGWLSKRSKK